MIILKNKHNFSSGENRLIFEETKNETPTQGETPKEKPDVKLNTNKKTQEAGETIAEKLFEKPIPTAEELEAIQNIDELFKALGLRSGYNNRVRYAEKLYHAGINLFPTNSYRPNAKENGKATIRQVVPSLYIGESKQNAYLKEFLIHNREAIIKKAPLKTLKIPPKKE